MCVQSSVQLAFTEGYFEFKPKLSLEIINIPAFFSFKCVCWVLLFVHFLIIEVSAGLKFFN